MAAWLLYKAECVTIRCINERVPCYIHRQAVGSQKVDPQYREGHVCQQELPLELAATYVQPQPFLSPALDGQPVGAD